MVKIDARRVASVQSPLPPPPPPVLLSRHSRRKARREVAAINARWTSEMDSLQAATGRRVGARRGRTMGKGCYPGTIREIENVGVRARPPHEPFLWCAFPHLSRLRRVRARTMDRRVRFESRRRLRGRQIAEWGADAQTRDHIAGELSKRPRNAHICGVLSRETQTHRQEQGPAEWDQPHRHTREKH